MRYTLLLCLALLLFFTVNAQKKEFYTERWSDVYKNEFKDLPQSALKIVDTIYYQAKKEKNFTEITKSLLYQSKFAMILKEKAEIIVIQKFKKEIAASHAPLRNILESMLAEIYWQYFQENRWKYYNRSEVSEMPTDSDFTAWDAAAMLREIDKHYQASLLDANILQDTPLEKFDDILALGHRSKQYRPTLYDFLLNNALDFYSTNEDGLQNPGDKSITLHDYYGPIDNIHFDENSKVSTEYRTLKLFRDLLVFHQQRRDSNAYVNLEIERLKYVAEHSDHRNETQLLKDAYLKLKAQYITHPASTLVDIAMASIFFEEGLTYSKADTTNRFSKKSALDLCNEAIARFPESDGAMRCRALKEKIFAKDLALKIEEFVPVSKPSLLFVEYTNIKNLSLRVYRVSQEFQIEFYQEQSDSARLMMLTHKTPVTSWSASLPFAEDCQDHSTELVFPALTSGYYLVVTTEGSQALSPRSIFAYASFCVTDLVVKHLVMGEAQRFQVINRNNGKPIQGASVHLRSTSSSKDVAEIRQHGVTNKNGFISVDNLPGRYWSIETDVSYAGDTILSLGYDYYNRSREEDDEKRVEGRTFIFTDRSIYRPGQTIFFKGILIKRTGNKSEVVPGEYVEVYLDDTNNREIRYVRLRTNAFGSFSGEFKLPTTGLTGEFDIYADEDSEDESKFFKGLSDFDYNEAEISVEEYKRPTFEVTFKPVAGSYKVNDTIRVTGNAIAFSGAKLSKAKVSYTVTRAVSFPSWYYWQYNDRKDDAVMIAHAEVATDANGAFVIPFNAIPGDADTDGKPVFTYAIDVDVTDINGETRSGSSKVNVGYHTMVATVEVSAEINRLGPVSSLSFNTENLNGQFLPAVGTIKIYKLTAPERPMRARRWEAPEYYSISRHEFEKLFPSDHYEDDVKKFTEWKKGKLVKEIAFNTKESKEHALSVEKTWEVGMYIVELTTKDSLGQIVEDKKTFKLIDPNSTKVADNALLTFHKDKQYYKIGDVVKFTIGSAAPDVYVTIEVEKNGQIVKTHVEHLTGNAKVISIPVTDVREGAFSIHASAAVYNSLIRHEALISLETRAEKFVIETETFKDKLLPDQKQTWSFVIQGEEGKRVEAEAVAAMYDASLDQFKPHEWSFHPREIRRYYSHYEVDAWQSFDVNDFVVKNISRSDIQIPKQNYDAFDWFGFSITSKDYARRRYMERLYYDVKSTGQASKVTMHQNRGGRIGFVSGRLTTNTGDPLPGVSILVKGTMRGTTTDTDGAYTLEAGKDDVLIFSFIGYVSAEVEVGRKNTVDVALEEDLMQLSEVVVVGYGVQEVKSELAASAVFVAKETVDDGDVVFYTLDGKTSGVVSIAYNKSQRLQIRIRGNESTVGDAQALYVVDGVIMNSGVIDHNDIEKIQVLKGAAATAIYGSAGANGVIIINTKSGQQKIANELAKVNARKNFNETAFFFPDLSTDDNGKIRFSFRTPESLTKWKLQLLAHTKDLLVSTRTLYAVTQKVLMVTPNVPRFVRVNDEVIISTKIANLSNKKVEGKVVLQLTNAATGAPVDDIFSNVLKNQIFRIDANGNADISWRLKIPLGVDAVQYKVVAKAGNFSDGEQNVIPVLSSRMLITETLPFYVRSNQTKTFNFDKLRNQSSTTLQTHQLTLEVTSNPAWYAVQALPYLMEYPHECAEQLFSRYYANAMAAHVMYRNPKIEEVFKKWSGSGTLVSNLDENQELKSILVEETPWIRDAQNETEQKKRIALLFDFDRMEDQSMATTKKLREMQFTTGGFPWFNGAREADRYITQHIACGFGHLEKLKIRADKDMADMMANAMRYLDAKIVQDFNEIKRDATTTALNGSLSGNQKLSIAYLDEHVPSNLTVHYLYMRSFYPNIALGQETQAAIQYFRRQTASKWQQYNLYQKAMIALEHYRNGNQILARDILKSLKQNAISSDELGMYWKDNVGGWHWHESAVETQALLIEAFAEIQADDTLITVDQKQTDIDEMRVWLLKNKQTNAWRTTKATTEAAYALLLNGTDWLPLENNIQIHLGDRPVDIKKNEPEAGTGYFKTSFPGNSVKPEMGKVDITKKGDGISWGGVYWQYFEDLDKITSADTPLKVKKNVYKVVGTDKGEVLHPATGETLKPGDLLRVRIELTADRPMEYLHMKDMRAAGFEPADVLSGYKWQESLGYYQSTRDVATNFFFDRMAKGVYVFEYDLRVNVRGNFSNGVTTIQSMYAPEFSSHSEGIRVVVE